MKFFLLLPLLLLFASFTLLGQSETANISGTILDTSDKSPLPGVAIQMINIRDSTKSKFAVTDLDGNFQIKSVERAFYKFRMTSLGYKPVTRVIRITEGDIALGNIGMEQDIEVLGEVEIEGEVVAMEERGDTTVYNAAAFKTNPDANADDLVSKMPGIVVSSDGVTANGETIEQVLVDGKRFFGQDPLLSLKTIPAEIVNKVEVYDEQSDQSKLTGFNDGNTTKTMNLVTKEDKRNGQFGKFYAGVGNGDQYQIGGNLNVFNNDQRITIVGMSNNINNQNFSNQDLAGISGGSRGGFRGSNRNFMTGTQNGITNTNSFGINYSDQWNEKTSIEASYFYNQTSNTKDQTTDRETFLTDETQYYHEDQVSDADNMNHRLNLRLDHKINENNQLMLRSSFGYQDNNSFEATQGETTDEEGGLINSTNNTYSSINKAYNINNNLIYQHKFEKIGRTLSVEVSNTLSPTERKSLYTEPAIDSTIQYLTDEFSYAIGGSVTYTEPVGNSAQLSASYNINNNKRSSDKQSFVYSPETGTTSLSTSLSNKFESGYTTHSPSVFYSIRNFGKFFNAGLTYQYATLNNDQTYPQEGSFGRNFNSLLPTMMGRVEFSEDTDAFFRYSTSTNEPSVSQLQNVINNSNPLFVSIGNPELKQSYNHQFMMRLHSKNIDKNTSFSNFFRVQNTRNYITNETEIIRQDSVLQGDITLQRGAQISKPTNLNGYWSVNNSSTYSVLISPIKTNLNTTLGLGYTRRPGYTNLIRNISNTYSGSLRMSLSSNISEKIDYNLYYQTSGNLVENSIQSGTNSNYITQNIGGKLNLTFGKGFVFRTDLNHLKYNGVNESSDVSYTLWNMSMAKKILKNDAGEIAVSVFDLLGENQSINQNVTASYLEETQTEVLRRYFMLTFTYNLRRFGKS